MNYDIQATANPLTKSDLYEGRTVCLSNVNTNPNNIGILVKSNSSDKLIKWQASINNVVYHFDSNGKCKENNSIVLYGIRTTVNLDLTTDSSITRGAGAESVVTSLNSLIPKDQFAICALEALISTMPNAISMDDSTILSLAIKSYKISQAMLYIGTLARAADAQVSPSSDPVSVDGNNLTDNLEKILYNINETLKSIKTQDANHHSSGVKIADIVPTVKVDNPTNEEFDVNGAGGGGITYNTLPDLATSGSTAITHVLGFGSGAEQEKYTGKITFSAFATKVWDTLKDTIKNFIDNRGVTNIDTGGAWNANLTGLIDSRITTKVKAESLNS